MASDDPLEPAWRRFMLIGKGSLYCLERRTAAKSAGETDYVHAVFHLSPDSGEMKRAAEIAQSDIGDCIFDYAYIHPAKTYRTKFFRQGRLCFSIGARGARGEYRRPILEFTPEERVRPASLNRAVWYGSDGEMHAGRLIGEQEKQRPFSGPYGSILFDPDLDRKGLTGGLFRIKDGDLSKLPDDVDCKDPAPSEKLRSMQFSLPGLEEDLDTDALLFADGLPFCGHNGRTCCCSHAGQPAPISGSAGRAASTGSGTGTGIPSAPSDAAGCGRTERARRTWAGCSVTVPWASRRRKAHAKAADASSAAFSWCREGRNASPAGARAMLFMCGKPAFPHSIPRMPRPNPPSSSLG